MSLNNRPLADLFKGIIRLIRPKQWAKNGFVFLPLFFAHEFFRLSAQLNVIVAFISFCLISSSIYCLNDMYDAEADRQHPQKCNRPIASGAISNKEALVLLIVLCLSGLIIAYAGTGNIRLLGVFFVYYVINVLYCVWLKKFAIVDVFIIATGFVLRLFAGGVAGNVELSHWIILMTFLLALFLAFAKRSEDVLLYEKSGSKARSNIARYNLTFIYSALNILSTITIVCYIMYTVSPEIVERFGSSNLYLTSVFVVAGILRYMQRTQVDTSTGSPTKILYSDWFIQACVFFWILTFLLIIYVF